MEHIWGGTLTQNGNVYIFLLMDKSSWHRNNVPDEDFPLQIEHVMYNFPLFLVEKIPNAPLFAGTVTVPNTKSTYVVPSKTFHQTTQSMSAQIIRWNTKNCSTDIFANGREKNAFFL